MTTNREVRSGKEAAVTNGYGKGSGFAAFLSAAFRSPREMGTAMPSGPHLARRLAAVVPDGGRAERPPVVLEVGAGTGAITGAIVARAGSNATVIAVERDAKLADVLRSRDLGADVVTADADSAVAILAERGIKQVDAVVSALPWTLLNQARQHALLQVFGQVLRPEGAFTTACYSYALAVPAAQRFRRELAAVFEEVIPTRTVWRNPPPAMTYVCRRPLNSST